MSLRLHSFGDNNDLENRPQESTMNNAAVTDLGSLVETVLYDDDSLANYGRDWSRIHQPKPSAVVFPRSADEVQKLVLHANQKKLALVPSGGRTGMSGAALAPAGEIVVSRTVKDLVAGSGIAFEDFGTHALKGIPDEHQLYVVTST